jgi:predicted DCC family thiol-disulfide oxidoreductase YuxK
VNGWTGGQYSLYRALLGLALLVRFATPFTYDRAEWLAARVPVAGMLPNVWSHVGSGWGPTLLLVTGAILSFFLAAGRRDRIVALPLSYLVAAGFASHRHGDPGWWLLAGMLLIHAATPAAPFGSWDARGRVDPAGGWRMPRALQRTAWTAAAVVYAYHGVSGLVAAGHGGEVGAALSPWLHPAVEATLFPLTLLFAPVALVRPLRPRLWALMILLHVVGAVAGWGGWHLPMILSLGMLFDPGWIPGGRGGTDRVFYDGGCGLCHGTVRFLLAEDSEARFRFAPLDGESFRATVGPERREGLPDSVVVTTAAGELLVRSAAIRWLLGRLGGLWRLLSLVAWPLPRRLADVGYDAVARVRFGLFGRRDDWCPVIPERLAGRFES